MVRLHRPAWRYGWQWHFTQGALKGPGGPKEPVSPTKARDDASGVEVADGTPETECASGVAMINETPNAVCASGHHPLHIMYQAGGT